MQDAASLNNLRDIAESAPVSWWPLAPGWWALIAVTLVVLSVYAFRAWRHWKANAYRRAALAELRLATNDAAVAEILKRTALCAYPREKVASLTGENWCQWLRQTGGKDVTAMVTEHLSAGVFQNCSTHTKELTDFATHWTNSHRIQTKIPRDGKKHDQR